MSKKVRWAVLLCKCRGVADRNDIKQYFVSFFTEGLGGAVDYWRDISFLELDLRESGVFGWFELLVTSQQMLMIKRSDSIQMAIDTACAINNNVADFGPKLVFISEPFIGQNVNVGGEAGAGASGGNMSVDLGGMRASFILHEMGHVHGLVHTRFMNGNDYGSPYCLMSAEQYGNTDPRYDDERFGKSGPGLCSPYTHKAGWLPELNVVRIQSNGKRPATTTCFLNTFQFHNTVRQQVAVVDFDTPQQLSYFVEYRRAEAWDRGLAQDAVAIHQMRPDGFAYYAGAIATSVGFAGGVTLLPGRAYVDSQFDLSVEVIPVFNDGTIKIRIAPAAAVGTLSVRSIAKSKLRLTSGFSVGNQVLQNTTTSLRDRLVDLLGQ